MIVTIISAIILYLFSAHYLDFYNQVRVEKCFEHYTLNKKRNQYLAGTYLIIAMIVGWLFPNYGYGILEMVKGLYLIGFSLIIAYIDKKEQIIPNRLLVILLWSTLVFRVIEITMNPSGWIAILGSAITGFFVGGGIFLVAYIVSRSGIGAGDVKLFAVLGLYVGNYTVIGIMMISLLLTAIVGGISVVAKKMKMKESLPFGPFVSAGVILALLLGF